MVVFQLTCLVRWTQEHIWDYGTLVKPSRKQSRDGRMPWDSPPEHPVFNCWEMSTKTLGAQCAVAERHVVRLISLHSLTFGKHLVAIEPTRYFFGRSRRTISGSFGLGCWGGPSQSYPPSHGEDVNWRHHHTSTAPVMYFIHMCPWLVLRLSRQSTCWLLRWETPHLLVVYISDSHVTDLWYKR